MLSLLCRKQFPAKPSETLRKILCNLFFGDMRQQQDNNIEKLTDNYDFKGFGFCYKLGLGGPDLGLIL